MEDFNVDCSVNQERSPSKQQSPLRDRLGVLVKKNQHSKLQLASLGKDDWKQPAGADLFVRVDNQNLSSVIPGPVNPRGEEKNNGDNNKKKMSKVKSASRFGQEKEGHYAMLTKDHTWQQVGKVDGTLEKPASRRDILLLQKQFERAMHASQRDIRLTRKPGSGLKAEAGMEQDIVAMKETVREMLFPTKLSDEELSELVQSEKDKQEKDKDTSSKGRTRKTALRTQTNDGQRNKDIHVTLTTALFEQKWTDLILGELEGHVMVSCLEQGKLLHKIRNQLATSFALVCTAQSMTCHDLHEMTKMMLVYKKLSEDLTKEQQTIRDELNKHHHLELLKHEEMAQCKYQEYEEIINDAKASKKRMSDTLLSLNTVYKKMRDDADVLRTMDLNDACARLEKKLKKAIHELDELRPLKQEKEELTNRVHSQEYQISALNDRVQALELSLEKREALLQEMLQQNGINLSKEELDKEGVVTGIIRQQQAQRQLVENANNEGEEKTEVEEEELEEESVAEDAQDNEDENIPDEGALSPLGEENAVADLIASDMEPAPPEVEVQEPTTPKSKKKGKRKSKKKRSKSVDIKPKTEEKPSDYIVAKDLIHTTDTVQVEEGIKTFEPTESAAQQIRDGMDEPSLAKTFLCPRCHVALDRAGNIDDKFEDSSKPQLVCTAYRMLLPNLMGYRPERPRAWTLRCMRSIIKAKRRADFSADRLGKPRTRFPQFVYMWFAPRDETIRELKNTNGNEAVLLANAEADENRWGLYYGVRALSEELPEARVFYTFLDEKFGQDDFAFYLHSLTIMEAVMNEHKSSMEWGSNTDALDYETLQNSLEAAESLGKEDPIDDFIFIEIKHAAETVKRVMSRASEEDSKRAVKTLVGNAVEEEIRITPTTGQRIIDVNVCLRVLLQEYRDEQAHRRAALRLMFGCAVTGANDQLTKRSVDLRQLITIVQALNSRATVGDAIELYRLASELGRGKVTIDSFSEAADKTNFLTNCLRLPSHFGTEAPNKLSEAQCAQIGINVRQQMAFLEPLIEKYKTNLDPWAKRTLVHLVEDVNLELERGGLTLDGRRCLCAIRRMLYFMLGERNGRRELFGEQESSGDASVLNAKREIDTMAQLLRDFTENETEVRLNNLQVKHSAAMIQKRWRRKQEVAPGIPPAMRKLLSVCFEPGVLIPVKKRVTQLEANNRGGSKKEEALVLRKPVISRRRLARPAHQPVDFVLLMIDEIYRYKMFVDAKLKTSTTGYDPLADRPGWDHKPGISLEEAVHGAVLRLVVVPAIAERIIHDFFMGVHKFASHNLRIRLFARFTGVRSPALRKSKRTSALDPVDDDVEQKDDEIRMGPESDWSFKAMKRVLPVELRSQDAIDTYSTALAVLYDSRKQYLPIFPAYDERGIAWIRLEKALEVVKKVFQGAVGSSRYTPCGPNPSKKVFEECMLRLERQTIEQGMVDVDRFLLIVLQGWHSEQIYRKRALADRFFNHMLDAANSNDSRIALNEIVSLTDFASRIAPSLDPTVAGRELAALSCYRKLIAICDPKPHLTLEKVTSLLRSTRKLSWSPGLHPHLYTTPSRHAGPVETWKLLVYIWSPYQSTFQPLMSDMTIQLREKTYKLAKQAKEASLRAKGEDEDADDGGMDGEFDAILRRQEAEHRQLVTTLEKAHGEFQEHYDKLKELEEEDRTLELVMGAWTNFHTLFTSLQRIRAIIGIGHEPIMDEWDSKLS